jgi:hypothetical protein
MIGAMLYILFCWIQHNQAIHLTKIFAQSLNEELIQVASLPQPLSPFRWANYVETKDKVYRGLVDLVRKEEALTFDRQSESISEASFFEKLRKFDSLYQPPGKVHYQSYQKLRDFPWLERILTTEGVKFFYRFAQFPVVKSVHSKDRRYRVELMDIRFLIPGIRLPFVYYVEFDDSGKIQSEGFVGDRKRR